jgi:LacI family transcriptional regulator
MVRFIMKALRDSGYLETFAPWKSKPVDSSVAVLTPMFGNAWSGELFRGIDRVMSALGLSSNMVAFPTRYSPVVRENTLKYLSSFNMIDAVICLGLTPEAHTAETYANLGKPLVLVQTRAPKAQSVLLENQQGMAIGVNYLFGKGLRRIALVNGPTLGMDPGSGPSERLIGYLSAIQRKGLRFDESLVFEAPNFDADGGARAFEYYRKLPEFPQAVFFAAGDMSAVGFCRAALEAGMRIPQDVAVLGYDDLPVASLVTPGLSTIRQRLMLAGAAALVLALESRVTGPGENLVIMPELVERGTV